MKNSVSEELKSFHIFCNINDIDIEVKYMKLQQMNVLTIHEHEYLKEDFLTIFFPMYAVLHWMVWTISLVLKQGFADHKLINCHQLLSYVHIMQWLFDNMS